MYKQTIPYYSVSEGDAKGFSWLWSRVQVNAEVVIPHLKHNPGTHKNLQSAVETNSDKTLQAFPPSLCTQL